MKKLLYLLFLLSLTFGKVYGVDYNASAFGCVSDGQTNNTRSIQAAIDLISSKGGGTLNFYVGRYLTGGLELKSNVTIQLHEGAVLVASSSYYDFMERHGRRYLIYAEQQAQIKIMGKGVIQGQSAAVLAKIEDQVSKGLVTKSVDDIRPTLIGLNNCQQVELDGIMLSDATGDMLHIDHCTDVRLKNQIIRSHNHADSKGIVLHQSTNITLENLYVDTTGKALLSDKASKITEIKKSITPDGKSI